MKTLYKIMFLLLITSATASGQENNQPLSPEEASVKNIVMALPEVKAKDKVYDSVSNRVQRMLLHITPPDSVEPLYKVEAGYQGNNRFQPHFYFYIDLPGNMVYIEDLQQGDRTTLDEWRRRRNMTTASY